jgi:hypothetical protein
LPQLNLVQHIKKIQDSILQNIIPQQLYAIKKQNHKLYLQGGHRFTVFIIADGNAIVKYLPPYFVFFVEIWNPEFS